MNILPRCEESAGCELPACTTKDSPRKCLGFCNIHANDEPGPIRRASEEGSLHQVRLCVHGDPPPCTCALRALWPESLSKATRTDCRGGAGAGNILLQR